MQPAFKHSGAPATRADVQAAEAKLGLAFPVAYIDFLLRTNGGSPSPSCFLIPGHSEEIFELHYFFQIGTTNPNLSLLSAAEGMDGAFPDGWLQIATTTTGDHLLIDCRTEDTHVYFCDWIGRSDARASDSGLGLVEFLNSMFECTFE